MKKYTLLLLTGFLSLFLTFCSENHTDSHDDHDDDHVEAVGMRLISGTTTLTEYIKDDVSKFSAVTATIGDTTDQITFQVFKEDGIGWITPHKENVNLKATIADPTVFEIIPKTGSHGQFEFFILGKKAGSTTVTFRVIHDGHGDFESRPVNITISSKTI